MFLRPIAVALLVVAVTTPSLVQPPLATASFGPSTVTALSVTDPVDVYWGEGDVTVEVTASDPAGITSIDVAYTTPNGQTTFSNAGPATPVSSDATTMTATDTLTVNKAYAGTWSLEIDIVNKNGESSELRRAKLEGLALPGSFQAIDGAPGTPGVSTNVVATTMNTPDDRTGTAVLNWDRPTSGAKVTSYKIVATPTAGPEIDPAPLPLERTYAGGVLDTTSAGFPGLINGLPYSFTITAYNGTTPGETTSASNAVTTFDLPLAPANVAATGGLESATVSWDEVTDTGGHGPVALYRVWPSKSSTNPVPVEVPASATSATVDGLTPGTSHQFRVAAVTEDDVASNPSAYSAAVTVTGPPPGAPGQITGYPTAGAANLQWTAPSVNAGNLTGYTLTASPGGLTMNVAANQDSAIFQGLINGTDYTFTVTASNQWGTSEPSESSAVMRPLPPPGVPTNVRVVVGDGRVRISWEAPTSGAPVSNYTVETYGQQKCNTVELDCVITGLSNDETYAFHVRAHSGGFGSSPEASSEAVKTSPVDTSILYGPPNTAWQLQMSPAVAFTLGSNLDQWSMGTCRLTEVLTGRTVAAASCRQHGAQWAGVRPGTYQARFAAMNSFGQLDTTPATMLFTIPRYSTQLTNGRGWTRRTGKAYYSGRYSIASKRGATITTKITRARRVSLIATRAPKAGIVNVYLGSTRVATIRLAASRTKTRQIIPIGYWPATRSGTLRIVVASSRRPVKVEGLAVFTPPK